MSFRVGAVFRSKPSWRGGPAQAEPARSMRDPVCNGNLTVFQSRRAGFCCASVAGRLTSPWCSYCARVLSYSCRIPHTVSCSVPAFDLIFDWISVRKAGICWRRRVIRLLCDNISPGHKCYYRHNRQFHRILLDSCFPFPQRCSRSLPPISRPKSPDRLISDGASSVASFSSKVSCSRSMASSRPSSSAHDFSVP
jgi:hypothetical protein